jgi:hypothetical protein
MIKPPTSAVCAVLCKRGFVMKNVKNGSATRFDVWEYLFGKPYLG